MNTARKVGFVNTFGFPNPNFKPVRRFYPRRIKSINQRTSGFVGASGDAKFVDTDEATYACDTTGTVTHLDIVPRGSSVNEREGKNFRNTSIQIRGSLKNGSTASVSEAVVLIVWDKQPNKALAVIGDVLDSVASTAMNKRENASRFVIIRRYDNCLTGKGDGTSAPGYFINFDQYIKLPPDCIASCTDADTTGAIGNRISGALLMMTLGSNVAGTTASALTCTVRVNFEDI